PRRTSRPRLQFFLTRSRLICCRTSIHFSTAVTRKKKSKCKTKRARSCIRRRSASRQRACACQSTVRIQWPSAPSFNDRYLSNKRAKFYRRRLDWNWWTNRTAIVIRRRLAWLEKTIVRWDGYGWTVLLKTVSRFGCQAINYSKAQHYTPCRSPNYYRGRRVAWRRKIITNDT